VIHVPAMLRVLVLAASLASLAGCATPAPAPGADLADPRGRWAAAGLSSYAYDLEISCFCIHRGRYAVEVRGGEIADVRDATTRVASPRSRVEWIVTVDRLFEVMALAEGLGTPVRAEYHPDLGYPVEAEVGLLADDSGTLYRIENLRPL
jgi:hypothetical protein